MSPEVRRARVNALRAERRVWIAKARVSAAHIRSWAAHYSDEEHCFFREEIEAEVWAYAVRLMTARGMVRMHSAMVREIRAAE